MRAKPYCKQTLCGIALAGGRACRRPLGAGAVVCHVHRKTEAGQQIAKARRLAAAAMRDQEANERHAQHTFLDHAAVLGLDHADTRAAFVAWRRAARAVLNDYDPPFGVSDGEAREADRKRAARDE